MEVESVLMKEKGGRWREAGGYDGPLKLLPQREAGAR